MSYAAAREAIDTLTREELTKLRAAINGKLGGCREISAEQQERMKEAREMKRGKR